MKKTFLRLFLLVMVTSCVHAGKPIGISLLGYDYIYKQVQDPIVPFKLACLSLLQACEKKDNNRIIQACYDITLSRLKLNQRSIPIAELMEKLGDLANERIFVERTWKAIKNQKDVKRDIFQVYTALSSAFSQSLCDEVYKTIIVENDQSSENCYRGKRVNFTHVE
ncbi:MAG: hypothetical protein M1114_01540 [Candidatus Dependentiae bacterium]|nr:hypothetical protein [Candidatus Dependentiae bacterium]